MITRTRFLFSSIALALLVAPAGAEEKGFRAGAAADYAHQTTEKVTIGAKAYDTQDLTVDAFGRKADLLKYGVLPVLVVVENHRDKSLNLENLEVSLVGSDGRHVAAVNPEDVPFLAADGHRKPKQPGVGVQLPVPVPLPKKKNPLGGPEIVERAFAAKMLPPGETASGFFYFEAQSEVGDSLYLNGMRDARSGKEILYSEFPLKKDPAAK